MQTEHEWLPIQNTSRICAIFLQPHQVVTDINVSHFDPFLLKAEPGRPPWSCPWLHHRQTDPRKTRPGKPKSEPPSRSANSAQLRLQMRKRAENPVHSQSSIWLLCVYTRQFAAQQTDRRRSGGRDSCWETVGGRGLSWGINAVMCWNRGSNPAHSELSKKKGQRAQIAGFLCLFTSCVTSSGYQLHLHHQ